jgi:4-aminobutyrate aminotransferase / (S)-3-amino-2-methylpropionate transaminase / 5-aminovalerate transaminase
VADGARPELVCLGKGLGGGIAIAACIGSHEVMQAWARGGEVVHTSTHAGAPLACAAALATLDVLEGERLIERAGPLGAHGMAELSEHLGSRARVRGAGMMIGIELASAADAQRMSRQWLEAGVLVLTGGVAGNVITLTPPLTLHPSAWSIAVEALKAG